MTATLHVRVLCSPFPRYTEKPCDNGQESSRVDEELRLLHNHRRARCLDVQCNAHCRLCTVGLTKRHCSSQFREYVLQITDQRGEFSGELVSIADIEQRTNRCNARRHELLCLVPKSSHYENLWPVLVGRYVGSPFHLRFHIFFHLPCGVRTGLYAAEKYTISAIDTNSPENSPLWSVICSHIFSKLA